MSEKQQQPETCTVIYETLQVCSNMGSFTITLLQTYWWICFNERIFKIKSTSGEVTGLRKLIAYAPGHCPAERCRARWRSDVCWAAGTVVTKQHRITIMCLVNLDLMIDTYQTGTANHLWLADSDWCHQRLNVHCVRRRYVGRLFSVILWVFGVFTVNTFSPVNKMMLTLLCEYFPATVVNGWVLHDSLLHSALRHGDFWTQTFLTR